MAWLKTDQAMIAEQIRDIGALPVIIYAEDIPGLLDLEVVLREIILDIHTTIAARYSENGNLHKKSLMWLPKALDILVRFHLPVYR